MIERLAGVQYWNPPRGYGGGLDAPRLVVLHDTANPRSSARNEATYAATRTDSRDRWTSAHFYVDEHEAIGSVPLDKKAWAAFEANAFAWHIEMCYRDGGVPLVTRQLTARLIAALCRLGAIPMAKVGPAGVKVARGVCGHWDVTQAYAGNSPNPHYHTDPGKDFAWVQFMALVTGNLNGATAMSEQLLNGWKTPVESDGRDDGRGVGIWANEVWKYLWNGVGTYDKGTRDPINGPAGPFYLDRLLVNIRDNARAAALREFGVTPAQLDQLVERLEAAVLASTPSADDIARSLIAQLQLKA